MMNIHDRNTDARPMPEAAVNAARYALAGGRIFTGERFLPEHAVLIEQDKILAVCPERELPAGMTALNVNGAVIAPGFIDLQVNGCGGVMFNDAVTLATLEHMHAANLKSGCTSFMPTLVTASDEDMLAAMRAAAEYRRKHGTAGVLGLHLEGPYINRRRKGIHNEAHIRLLDAAMRERLCAYAGQHPLMLTLAPECVEEEDIRKLAAAGALISIGHSDATFEEAKQAIAAGARAATHLFNAMSQWRSREPGVVGAVLESSDLPCGMIVDGLHSHFASVMLAKRLKQNLCYLVTDGTAASGSDVGRFNFCGQTVYVQDGRCVSGDGTLGGSNLTMIRAVENCVRHAGLTPEESLRMASLYPARVLGQDHLLGGIAPGKYANLVVYDPATFAVSMTVDRGRRHLQKKASRNA